uniref:histidine kinase n=1 Tax=Pseudo-nitzschia australis TaxID=44445 RepID=A0A7S4EIY1_9STRA|mmetsp:Transcript_20708/g.45082  ORF Transcript_20708/g.45082 Transcript_20708/m.45082 type:complete len:1091 (-) Transcript_20708:111-3383(-)
MSEILVSNGTSRAASTQSSTFKSGIDLFLKRGNGNGSSSGKRNSRRSSNSSSISISGNNKFKYHMTSSVTKSSGSSTGLRSGNSTASTIADLKRNRNIGYGRIALTIVLMGCAGGFGFASYALMENAESRLAKDRFDSIAERAESSAEWVLQQKKQATDALALMVGSANPDASEWPFVYMERYKEIASSLKLITKGSLSFCPIVKGFGFDSDEQQRFQEYYYNLYEEWGYPNGTGVSAFGEGIFGYGYDTVNYEAWPDWRYPVLSNYSIHGLENGENIMAPFVQSDFGHHDALMLDVMFEYNRANVIHGIVACSKERKTAIMNASTSTSTMECGSITDMLWQPTKAADVKAGPAGIMMSPIYPRNDPETLTGFILHKQIWHDLLVHAFESDVVGIRVVLHTSTGKEHTYSVAKGEVKYVGNRTHTCIKNVNQQTYGLGPGMQIECTPDDEWVPFDDLEYLQDEKNFDYRRLNMSITDTEDLFMDGTVEYFMDIYATEEFVSLAGRIMGGVTVDDPTDTDGIPISIAACISTVVVMLFTSLLFVSYDYCVRQEFNSKEKLLEAKRRFVRFVSHEVRTPLNTVCMGLTLLQNDLAISLSEGNDKKATEEQSNNNSRSCSIGNDSTIVLKREIVEEWMSLSGQVFQNADAAVGVLSDLLNYDKIQMGTLALELSLINLWSALEKTVKEFQMSAKEQNVSLELDFSPLLSSPLGGNDKGVEERKLSPSKKLVKASELPSQILNCKVVGDKIRLIQVFRNLISNALKFSKADDNMTVRVFLDLLPERKQKQENISLHKDIRAEVTKIGSVSVEVIDEGAGMTQDQVDTVFEDGTQFDRNKLQAGGGSGLGLNIARGIVLEHGGTLTCSSQGLGRGCTFTLRAALYTDNNSMALRETKPSRISKVSPAGEMTDYAEAASDVENVLESDEFLIPHFRVLVVDDSVTNRKLCQRLLERNGHTTEGANNGADAVTMVKESLESGNFYDCILLDYEMPVMNGPDACQRMREMGCSSYIAGVTGNVMSEDVDHFRHCGANWVLPKPFQLKALEDQWVEDGVTPFTPSEQSGENMVRVDSSHILGDNLAVTFDSNVKPPKSP